MTIENHMFEGQQGLGAVETRDLPKSLEVDVKYPIYNDCDGHVVVGRNAFSIDQYKEMVSDQVKVVKVNGQDRILWEFKPVNLHLATGRAVSGDDVEYVHDRVGSYGNMHGILTRMAVLEKTLDLGKNDPKLLPKTSQNRFERELFGLKLSLAKSQASQGFSLASLPRVEAIYPEKSKEGVKAGAAYEKDTAYDKLVRAAAHPFTRNPASGSGIYMPTQDTVITSPAEATQKKPFSKSERGRIDVSFANTLGRLAFAGTTVTIAVSACTRQEIPPAVTDVVTGTEVSTEIAPTSTEIPGFIPKTETPIAIVSTPSESVPATDPTSTEIAPVVEVAPYPSSIQEFENGSEVLKGEDAEQRIKSLGAGDDLQALKDWYSSAGVPTSMQEVVICEGETGAHWNIMIKYPDGKYGIITLTSGPEAGKIVRDGGLVSYLYSENRPTFSYHELSNPTGYENIPQEVVADKNLWFAFSMEKDAQLLGWANLDVEQSEKWVDLQALVAPTPEGPMGTFASFEGVVHDAEGYHITVGDSQRVIDVAESSAEQQIVFDAEMSLYKIYDSEGHITAEYDPGQGKEGDVDYVPATGWVDIQKLASDLICQEGDGKKCMTSFSDSHIQDSVLFEMNSADIYRYVDVTDNVSGKMLGRDLLVQMVSRDINNKPIAVWLLIQSVPAYDPDTNNISSISNFFMSVNKQYGEDYKGKIFTLDRYKEWIKKGSMWTFSFSKLGRSYVDWLYKDETIETYDPEVANFISTGGVVNPLKNIKLVYNGGQFR